jgi:hypothetical protein
VRWRTLLALALWLAVVGHGCIPTPAEREAARRAWEARDQQRAAACFAAGGQWAGGGCVFQRD